MDTTYRLTGMHCGGCVRKIEQALAPFAKSVAVDLAGGQVTLADAKAGLAELAKAVAAAGAYQISVIPAAMSEPPEKSRLATYYPLLLIAGYVAIASLAGAAGAGDWMRHFMAGFFLVFSFFKLLDIEGFANSYAMYDLLARRWRPYGYVYPFCELALALAYLFQPHPSRITLWLTILLMSFSSLGVLESMRRKERIRCACLGAALNLPVSTVTLVEDLGMAVMAAVMLWG